MKKIQYRSIGKQTYTAFDGEGRIVVNEVDVPTDFECIYSEEEYNRILTFAIGEVKIIDDGTPEPDTASADDILNALLGVTE